MQYLRFPFRERGPALLPIPTLHDERKRSHFGAWTSSAGAFKSPPATCQELVPSFDEKTAQSMQKCQDVSFEILDLKAEEVLKKSIQAMESYRSSAYCTVPSRDLQLADTNRERRAEDHPACITSYQKEAAVSQFDDYALQLSERLSHCDDYEYESPLQALLRDEPFSDLGQIGASDNRAGIDSLVSKEQFFETDDKRSQSEKIMRLPKLQRPAPKKLILKREEEHSHRRRGASHGKRAFSRRGACSQRLAICNHKSKLDLLSDIPNCKTLSTALSLCQGVGEACVANAQARPLLIVAGKCVFRTTPPLDTLRLCCATDKSTSMVTPVDIAEPSVAIGSTLVDKTTEVGMRADCPTKTISQGLQQRRGLDFQHLDIEDEGNLKGKTTRRWPATMPELDKWIAETICKWLGKDDTLLSNSDRHPSASIRNSNVSMNIRSCPITVDCSKSEVPNLSQRFESLRDPGTDLASLEEMVGRAQTVHDLYRILQPVARDPLTPNRENLEMCLPTNLASIFERLGKDDVLQSFRKQIDSLEREIGTLSCSLLVQEH